MPKTAVINALQASGDASYDRARETLKGVSVDASGKVELEDWVEVRIIVTPYSLCDPQRSFQLNVKLKEQAAPILPSKAGKVIVQGSNANVSHTINEDERSEFTSHINGVCLSTLGTRQDSPPSRCSMATQTLVIGFPSRLTICKSSMSVETVSFCASSSTILSLIPSTSVY